jgi:hypothetical protein
MVLKATSINKDIIEYSIANNKILLNVSSNKFSTQYSPKINARTNLIDNVTKYENTHITDILIKYDVIYLSIIITTYCQSSNVKLLR